MKFTKFQYGIFNDEDMVRKLFNNNPQKEHLWKHPIYTYDDSPDEAFKMRDRMNNQRELMNLLATWGKVKVRRRPVRYDDWEENEYSRRETLLHVQARSEGRI